MTERQKSRQQTKFTNTTKKENVTFATGAVRSSVKPRYDLIPHIPSERIAKRFTGSIGPGGPTGGAFKFGECNWEKGLPTSDVINHTLDHIYRWADAFRESLKKNGSDVPGMQNVLADMRHHTREDDDLAGAAFGLIVLMYQEENGLFHDDRFKVFFESE